MFLLLANLLMLFVGCFLEPTAAITILVPILVPICQQLGIDPVHFGLVMVLNLMIGLLHPPMGMVLFVLARVAKLSVERTTMAILPWLVPLLGSLVIITYFPALVLWLPRMFFSESEPGDSLEVASDDSASSDLHPADDVVIARAQLVGGTQRRERHRPAA